MGGASVPTPTLYPAFFFVLEKTAKAQETQSYQRFQHVGHTAFNTSGTNAARSLSHLKVDTHSALLKGSHTAAYTPKQGLFRMGALSLPSDRFARSGNPAWPGVRTANFAALGSWPGGALEERRKPSGQRCAYAHRCSEGVAAPLGCVILLLLSKFRFVHPALRAFCVCEAWVVSLPSVRFACC